MDKNAKQIDTLDFNYLDQSEIYQYNVDQLRRVKACAPLMAKLGNDVAAWEQTQQAFDAAYRKVTTAAQTKTLKTIDDERGTIYSGLAGTINNATKSPIAAQAQAATKLQEPIKRYDVKVGGEYQQQTMRTEQLCQDLLANFATQLATLGLTEWVQALQAKNTEFQVAMNARTDDQAGFVKSELTQLKLQMISAYRDVRKMANAIFIYEGDGAYAAAIDQLNAEVRHYKQIIAHKGGPSSAGSGSGSGQNGGRQSTDNGQQTGGGGTGEGGGETPVNPGTDPVNPDPGTGGNDNPPGGEGQEDEN